MGKITAMTTAAPASTREQLLDCAMELIRRHGCNGFSYRDLAEQVGVKTSSIHYYFPAKSDLILEAVERYSRQVFERIDSIDASLSGAGKLGRYLELMKEGMCTGKALCLGGMVAFEMVSQDERVVQALRAFFRRKEDWLAQVLAEGERDGTLVLRCSPHEIARILDEALQGAALMARLFNEPERLAGPALGLWADRQS